MYHIKYQVFTAIIQQTITSTLRVQISIMQNYISLANALAKVPNIYHKFTKLFNGSFGVNISFKNYYISLSNAHAKIQNIYLEHTTMTNSTFRMNIHHIYHSTNGMKIFCSALGCKLLMYIQTENSSQCRTSIRSVGLDLLLPFLMHVADKRLNEPNYNKFKDVS